LLASAFPKDKILDLSMKVFLAQPRGFCAGVVRAIDIVERALQLYGAPVYVLHEIVHNQKVLADLTAKGAIFVETLNDIPKGAHTIFSAHGVSEKIVAQASRQNLAILDASCPLVTKVHLQSKQYEKEGHTVVIVGHQGHPEVEGIRGNLNNCYVVDSVAEVADLPDSAERSYAYVTQTTLSIDDTRELINALKAKFPSIVGPDISDICYATQNRQSAVKTAAQQADLVLVIGADNSSNSNRLREVAAAEKEPAYRIQSAADMNPEWFEGIANVGISAGASTPEVLVEEVITKLKVLFGATVETLPGKEEKIHFRLPREIER